MDACKGLLCSRINHANKSLSSAGTCSGTLMLGFGARCGNDAALGVLFDIKDDGRLWVYDLQSTRASVDSGLAVLVAVRSEDTGRVTGALAWPSLGTDGSHELD